jgi:hypothetical protein
MRTWRVNADFSRELVDSTEPAVSGAIVRLTRPRLKPCVVDFRAHSKNSSRHCLEEDQFHSLEYPAVFG